MVSHEIAQPSFLTSSAFVTSLEVKRTSQHARAGVAASRASADLFISKSLAHGRAWIVVIISQIVVIIWKLGHPVKHEAPSCGWLWDLLQVIKKKKPEGSLTSRVVEFLPMSFCSPRFFGGGRFRGDPAGSTAVFPLLRRFSCAEVWPRFRWLHQRR